MPGDLTPKAFASELESALSGRAPADRRILFVGVLNKYLPPNRKAVLVGGGAVEFYTVGGYTTGDVDLIGDRALVRDLLLSAGFREQGRLFLRPELGLVAEVLSMTRRPTEDVTTVVVEGYPVPILTVEDVIIDRLLAAKFWKSPTDWEQAILLAATHQKRLDRAKLREKAGPNEVEDVLAELLALVGRRP